MTTTEQADERISTQGVLCIVDGTPAADAALLAAITLAEAASTQLTVATCAPPPRQQCSRRFPASKWDQMMKELCAADLERAAETLARHRASADLIVLDDCGARAIARAAQRRDCGVVVLASAHPRMSPFVRSLRRRTCAEVVTVDPRASRARGSRADAKLPG